MFDMIDFLKRLVSLDTNSVTKSNYDKAAKLIANTAEKIGASVEIINAEAPDKKPRPNVFVKIGSKGKKILIITHFDVVPASPPWSVIQDPFKPEKKEEKIYGRGAADNKGAIAAVLAGFADILKEGEPKNQLIMIASCDEEVGGEYGLKWMKENYPELLDGDFAWIVDSDSEYIGLGASGVIWAKLKIKGKGGHAGIPIAADNPIYKLARVINQLELYGKWLENNELSPLKAFKYYDKGLPGRLSVTMISAGTKENVIPEEASLILDRRVPPGKNLDDAVNELKKKINEICRGLEYRLEIIRTVPSYMTDVKNPVVQRFIELSKGIYGELPLCGEFGGNDGVYFADKMPVVCLGEIRLDCNIHAKDEFVYLEDLEKLRRMVKKVAFEL